MKYTRAKHSKGKAMRYLKVFLFLVCILTNPAHAADETCAAANKKCVMDQMLVIAPKIDNPAWRDQTYRELAKSYTHEGMYNEAIALIKRIENPDTRAMTIRGIGFAAADGKWPRAKYDDLFAKLAVEARNITQPAAQGIAWTYIAMAQAFAYDDAGATLTAKSMENPALRHKAFAETAEIQAERGDFKAAMASIANIDTASFRNKAYRTVSKILAGRGMLQEAYKAAMAIDNPYTQTQALQTIVNQGNPEEDSTTPDQPDEEMAAE